VHADHDEAGLGRDVHQGRERVPAGVTQHRLIDDDDSRAQPPEQSGHVGEIRSRGKRLDAGLAFQQPP